MGNPGPANQGLRFCYPIRVCCRISKIYSLDVLQTSQNQCCWSASLWCVSGSCFFHFDADPDPTFHSDEDPDPDTTVPFKLMRTRIPPFKLISIRILPLNFSLRFGASSAPKWPFKASTFSLWCGSGSMQIRIRNTVQNCTVPYLHVLYGTVCGTILRIKNHLEIGTGTYTWFINWQYSEPVLP